MIKIDMWCGNKHTEADKIDICFLHIYLKYNIFKYTMKVVFFSKINIDIKIFVKFIR